jgi:glucose dehydrogenase
MHTGDEFLHALDKRTGAPLGTVPIPADGQYGLITYMHEGRQYVVVQIAGDDMPNSLAALRLP